MHYAFNYKNGSSLDVLFESLKFKRILFILFLYVYILLQLVIGQRI